MTRFMVLFALVAAAVVNGYHMQPPGPYGRYRPYTMPNGVASTQHSPLEVTDGLLLEADTGYNNFNNHGYYTGEGPMQRGGPLRNDRPRGFYDQAYHANSGYYQQGFYSSELFDDGRNHIYGDW
ncbi:expressed unknown protein [Seminavis robusta]|uniref:Uncharacterized protein n=1 Tax=Seminavis robusta TaxID=568900 RepID=A0A9N8HNP6_9STRA|nr:expressed unknown protein [Seminavis robusta]|eukprot:Sro839_g209260.1 n/a (124) ;mRNA; f:21331-21702